MANAQLQALTPSQDWDAIMYQASLALGTLAIVVAVSVVGVLAWWAYRASRRRRGRSAWHALGTRRNTLVRR